MKKLSWGKLNNTDIVLYVIYTLGGWQRRIHLEDIAIRSFKIAPTKFSWTKYPKYPDTAPARFALESLKKKKSNCLVEGESERKRSKRNIGGWMLTSNGVSWIKENLSRIELVLKKRTPTGTRLHSDRKLKALQSSQAFQKFLIDRKSTSITHAEFAESLLCTVNTEVVVLNDRLNQLYSIAEKLDEEVVKSYVTFCREKFISILKGNN